MPFQVYVDESGGKGQGRYFVMAGLISTAERWLAFSKDWQDVLDSAPKIEYFKMNEAAMAGTGCPCGHFDGMSLTERDAKLKALAAVINRYVDRAVYASVDVEEFLSTFAQSGADKPLTHLYFWPFYVMILGVCFDLRDQGVTEQFDIVFDNRDKEGQKTRRLYPLVHDILIDNDPEFEGILPVDPAFQSDKVFLPLQAADLFAWNFRRGEHGVGLNPFGWLAGELSSVVPSKYNGVLSGDRMREIMGDVEGRIRSGKVNLELVEEYRELMGG